MEDETVESVSKEEIEWEIKSATYFLAQGHTDRASIRAAVKGLLRCLHAETKRADMAEMLLNGVRVSQ